MFVIKRNQVVVTALAVMIATEHWLIAPRFGPMRSPSYCTATVLT